jgi:hypothetical protein
LFLFDDKDSYKTKINSLQENFNKNSIVSRKLKENLEILKGKIKESENISAQKMKELKNLNEFLNAVKSEVQKAHKIIPKVPVRPVSSKNFSVSSELREDIKKKIKETIGKVITSDEAEEILGKIKNSIRNVNLKQSVIENQMIELKTNFEEEKFSLLVEAKMKKEKIIQKIKENNEKITSGFYESSKVLKDELREDLKLARVSQMRFPFTQGEFDRVFQKFFVFFK